MLDNLKRWAKALKRDVAALYFAARDPETPLVAKVVAGLVAAYALSPIDLIPDFIPVLGYLDDLILVPLGILLAVRLVPEAVLCRAREKAEELSEKPRSLTGLLIILAVWLAALWLAAAWYYRSR